MARERKRLYNDYDAMNRDGAILASRIHARILPIVKEVLDASFDGRDVEAVIQNEVHLICAEQITIRSMARMRQSREAAQEAAMKKAKERAHPAPDQPAGFVPPGIGSTEGICEDLDEIDRILDEDEARQEDARGDSLQEDSPQEDS